MHTLVTFVMVMVALDPQKTIITTLSVNEVNIYLHMLKDVVWVYHTTCFVSHRLKFPTFPTFLAKGFTMFLLDLMHDLYTLREKS